MVSARDEDVILNTSRDIQPDIIVHQQDLRRRSPTRSTERLELAPDSAVLANGSVDADGIIGKRDAQPCGLGSFARGDKAEPYDEEPK